MENFDALLQNAGIDIPDIEVTNTGEAFEFFKHCAGKYAGIVGNFNVDYKGLDGKKCNPQDVGAKMNNYGQLELILTATPDKHGFRNGKFEIEDGQQYGEFMFRLYVPFDGDKQFQNKNFFDTFKIAGALSTDVIKPGTTDKDFKFDSKALGFYRGAPVSFEIKIGEKKGTAYATNLLLQDNLLTADKFNQRNKMLDDIYSKLNALNEAEKEARKAKKSQSEEDKAMSRTIGGDNQFFSSQLSPEDIMDEMMGKTDGYK